MGLGQGNLRWSGPLVTFSPGIKPFWVLPNPPPCPLPVLMLSFQHSAEARPCAGSMVPRESRHPLCSRPPPFIIPPPRLHWAGNGHSTADLPSTCSLLNQPIWENDSAPYWWLHSLSLTSSNLWPFSWLSFQNASGHPHCFRDCESHEHLSPGLQWSPPEQSSASLSCPLEGS